MKDKKLCQAKTRKGHSCKNFPMSGAKFCYIHSFGKWKGVPWWRNSTTHFVIGVLVAVYFGFSGPSRSVQNEMHNDMKVVLEKVCSDKLLEKYPGGYALLGFDSSKNYKFDSDKSSYVLKGSTIEQYEFVWDGVKISKITKDNITVELPAILYKPLNTRIMGCVMGFRRSIMSSPQRFPIKPAGVKNRIFVELIEDNASILVFAIGFKPDEN